MMAQEDALRAIDAAFGRAPYPGDERIAGAASACPSEYAYVAEYFRGKHWKDLTWRGLVEDYPGPHDACLAFMSPEGFRFYLPAYMTMGLTDGGLEAADPAVFALTPPAHDAALYELANRVGDPAANPLAPEAIELRRAWWQERVSGFTRPQKQAILAFLECVGETHWRDHPEFGPRDALSHWRAALAAAKEG